MLRQSRDSLTMSKQTDNSFEESSSALKSTRRNVLRSSLVLGTIGVGAASKPVSAATDGLKIDANQLTASHRWKTQQLSNSYSSPVVIATPVRSSTWFPATSSIDHITTGSFDYRLQRWAYSDDYYPEENIGSLVMEEGASTIDGTPIEAGTFFRQIKPWKYRYFESTFAEPPVVLTTPQRQDSRPFVVRNRNVTENGFASRLQEEEAEGWNRNRQEGVGYVAIEPGSGTLGGAAFEAGRETGVDHHWHTIHFDGKYDRPVFVADLQSSQGWNPCTLRYRNLTGTSVDVRVEEEQSADEETSHQPEVVGYVVVEAS